MRIRHKLLALMAGTAAVSGIAIGLGMFPLLSSAVEGRYIERLRQETELLASLLPSAGTPDYEALARDWGLHLDVRVTMIARDGRVLGDSSVSEPRLTQLENHAHRPEVLEAMQHGWGRAYRTSGSTGETFFYLAHRVDGHPSIEFIRIALPAWQVQRAELPYVWLIVMMMGVTPLLLTGLAYLAVRRWSRPLEDLSATASRIAGGEFDLRLSPGRDDEVGTLARSLERVRRAVTGKILELENERQFLGSVLAGMQEGLLIVDGKRRVRLANDTFRRGWSVRSDPHGRPLPEVVRHPAVLAAVENAFAGRDSRERVPDVGTGRVLEMHATRVTLAGPEPAFGVVVMFFDITRLERLESMRKEFVANVSHELRTPLTSIKASVLTLLEDDAPDRETCTRFLETIHRNTERMAALVEDLTDLSLIETGAIKLDVRPLDASAIARDVVAQLASKHAGLGLDVQFDMPSPFTLQADRRRLEQILVNLVDNAMKFNRPGGTVRLSGRDVNGHHEIRVTDSGTGIPADDLEKVFNRFYRVDPARSQELGGTGLGLAIVKHLVQLHGGRIHVESELGKGSTFVVEL